ncbi:tetratricopeptide repeat protein [Lentzea sp. NPDC005914]|uniref:tetratricopeptide repeat protein n=1 Tax=Lentzea sp. NPDC005914 TaxID=3154572 RepID=UPI0033F73A2A
MANLAQTLPRAISVAAGAVAVGVSINQVLTDRWNWWWLGVALGCAISAEALNQWRMRRDQRPHHALYESTTDSRGVPKRLDDVTLGSLGVHSSRFDHAPYAPRDVDTRLGAAFRDARTRVVMLSGDRLSGTTRTLAQAAKNHLGDHLLVAPVQSPGVSIADLVDQAALWARRRKAPGAVIWLERISAAWQNGLAAVPFATLPAGVWLLITVDAAQGENPHDSPQLDAVLRKHALRLSLGPIGKPERDHLAGRAEYADLLPVLPEAQLLGRLLVRWEQVREALTISDEESMDRVALLRLVSDWARLQLDTHRLLDRESVRRLFPRYRREVAGLRTADPVRVTGFKAALKWATARPGHLRPRLVERVTSASGTGYVPYPLLTALADTKGEPLGWQMSTVLQDYCISSFTAAQRRDIAYTALSRKDHSSALVLLADIRDQASPMVLYRLATWLEESDEVAAIPWYQQLARLDHELLTPFAAWHTGILLRRHGSNEEARRWFRAAVDTGHPSWAPHAMCELGMTAETDGDVDDASRWYRRAVDAGDPDHKANALHYLGNLMRDQGDEAAARHWYHLSVQNGHSDNAPRSMFCLGRLDRAAGDIESARRWFRRVFESGHPDEANNALIDLGRLDMDEGELEAAREWFERALATEDERILPYAHVNLGQISRSEGDVEAAREWFAGAAVCDNKNAASCAAADLGLLEYRHGDWVRAQEWYERAIRLGHPEYSPRAMNDLGVLLGRQGRLAEAAEWYGRAIASGHQDWANQAALNLADLRIAVGDHTVAEGLLTAVVDHPDPDYQLRAMIGMGDLEAGRGRPPEAERWYQRAIESGHPKLAPRAKKALEEMRRRVRETQDAARYAEKGYRSQDDPDFTPEPRPAHPAPGEDRKTR